MYKTLQLFTKTTFDISKLTSVKVIKNAEKFIINAKLIKAWIKSKLFIDLGLMK